MRVVPVECRRACGGQKYTCNAGEKSSMHGSLTGSESRTNELRPHEKVTSVSGSNEEDGENRQPAADSARRRWVAKRARHRSCVRQTRNGRKRRRNGVVRDRRTGGRLRGRNVV